MQEALAIINETEDTGFMVHFERKTGNILISDYFPDKHAGEDLITTEEEAWNLAATFAKKTKGKCINIYVINHNFSPVPDYNRRRISNRE